MSSKASWALWGAAFGVGFPVLALTIRWAEGGMRGALMAFRADPLLWIVLTAPVFLGAFACFGGRAHDDLRDLSLTLERRVDARTADLAALTGRMSLVLESMCDAMITARLDGALDGPPQAQGVAWFGASWEGKTLWEYLDPGNAKLRGSMSLGLEQVADDLLPLEVSLDQLPHRIVRGDRHFALEYRVIEARGRERLLLVVVRDVTATVMSERAETERAEHQAVVAEVLKDPAGFRFFRHESETLLEEAARSADARQLRHRVHTLKGNAAMYGFRRLAAACNDVEDAWVERGHASLLPGDEAALRRAFEASMATVTPFLAAERDDIVRVPRGDVLGLLEAVRSHATSERIVTTLRDWSLEPIHPAILRLASVAEGLAGRLGKRVVARVLDDGARADLATMAPFFQGIVHVVRNAVDHGIEGPEERVAKGKPEVGTLTLETRPEPDALVIRIGDDGRGIDWHRVGAKARQHGIPFDSHDDRVDALFCDGVSTAEVVSEISGRGVGLGALRETCRKLGIAIEIESEPGKGTAFVFRLPRNRRSLGPPRLKGPPAGAMSMRLTA